MSSPSSSSSATAGRSRSRLPRRSSVTTTAAALVVAAAVYALPVVAYATLVGERWAIAPLVAAVAVLGVAAVRIWSPLVVLGVVVESAVGLVAWFLIVASAATCGGSLAASLVEWIGGAAVAIGLAASQRSRGGHIFWAVPGGWILAGVWFAVWAHVIPGGSGACFT